MEEDFVLVPKQFYIQKELLVAKFLDDAQIQPKANFLAWLQRERQPQTPPKEPETLKTNKDLDKSSKYLEDLTIRGPGSREKDRLFLQRPEDLDNLEITDQDLIAIDRRDTSVSVSNFLYLSQQPNKKYQEQEYLKIFDEVEKSKHLITNNQAQRNYRKENTTTSKNVNQLTATIYSTMLNSMSCLGKLYRQGAAAFGSSQNLQRISNLSKEKVEKFLQSTNAHTKYGI